MHYKEEGVFEVLSERKDNYGRTVKSGFRRAYPRPQYQPESRPSFAEPYYEPQPYYRAVLRPVYIGQWANNLIWFALGFLGVPLLRLLLLTQ